MEAFSKVHLEKTIEWFRLAFFYGESTNELVEILSSYFPTKRAFDVSLQNLKAIGLVALNDEDKEIINQSNLIRGKRYQTRVDEKSQQNYEKD